MKAIILVGGEGVRLRPLTYAVVKSMVPVLNKPFLEHVIKNLVSQGISEIILAMGYKPESIYQYFKKGTGFDCKLVYSLEDKPLGTAGAIKNAAGHIDNTFFVLNGDTFSDIDYNAMLRFHRHNRSMATIALTRVEDPTRFGVVEADEKGKVKAFIEKPAPDKVTSHWINAGVYILEPEVLDRIPPGEKYMFERGVFPGMLADGEPVYAYKSEAYWIDMGNPDQYHQLNMDMLQGKCKSALCNVESVSLGLDGNIHETAKTSGPILMGCNCRIEENTQVRGPVIMGKDCRIKKGAVIGNTILWDGVTIGENASVLNSIVAGGAIIEGRAAIMGETIYQAVPGKSDKK
ncbi:MAG: NDP-sugar synthase [Dehalococcoidia bacterium]|nr:NDP-sugar synthase [Dehalococcoidia bacterium]MDD5493498.1 NDP-sugar synthase [Dehalococcoidia bacterium]